MWTLVSPLIDETSREKFLFYGGNDYQVNAVKHRLEIDIEKNRFDLLSSILLYIIFVLGTRRIGRLH